MKRNTINETPPTETTENLFSEEITNNVHDFPTTLKELRKTVDPNLIRQRAGRRDRDGNVHMVEYVEWHTVADVLDANAPNWAHTVKDISSIGDIVTVTVAITIDGVTREGTRALQDARRFASDKTGTFFKEEALSLGLTLATSLVGALLTAPAVAAAASGATEPAQPQTGPQSDPQSGATRAA